MYTAAVATQAANAPEAQYLIGLLSDAEQRKLRTHAGFLDARK